MFGLLKGLNDSVEHNRVRQGGDQYRIVTRRYNIQLVMEDSSGVESESSVVVEYPGVSSGPDGCISESIREFDGVSQFKRRLENSYYKIVKAVSSISC